ncbi:MAG: sulfatase family protein [Mariniblastus sp.]
MSVHQYAAVILIGISSLCIHPASVQGEEKTAVHQRDERPNILFIMSDDHACNAISAYGGRLAKIAPTPNIDRIASSGIRLDRCFVTNSICTPSRAVILSGQHSHINGVKTLVDAFPGPDSGTPNVASILQRSGYQTALVGKWHLRSAPWGFDYWKIGPGQGKYHAPFFIASTDGIAYTTKVKKLKRTKGYYTDLITDYATQWLDQRDTSKPFFLMLHHKAPHGKWEPADRHQDYLKDISIPEPDSLWEDFSHRSPATINMGTSITTRLKDRRSMVGDVQKPDWYGGPVEMAGMTEKEKGQAAYQKYLHQYLACVKAVDENVGRVLDYLDNHGLAENTLVIYTSDQGMFLGEHDYFDKRWIYEECFQMPFLARFPNRIHPGTHDQQYLCSNLDFAQTLLDYAQVTDAPEIPRMQGLSLKPILEGTPPDSWRDAVYYRYWMHLAHHQIPGHYGVRDSRYKLVFFHGLPLDAQLGAGNFPPSQAGWEFYDLEQDPNETQNVYDKNEYASEIRRLKQRLLDLKIQYDDRDDQYPELLKLRNQLWERSSNE